MRLLKELHRHPGIKTDGKTIYREAVRGIILNGQRLLMVYSAQNGDYKFPGGGIGAGESHAQALAREIREETGAVVAEIGPGFGKMLEYDIPIEPEFDVFKMASFYYWCRVEDILKEQCLDDYEAEMGFRPAWVTLDEAIRVNLEVMHTRDFTEFPWVPRDTYVLEQIRAQLGGSPCQI